MNVATRITAVTALVVALASIVYAVYDVRSRATERRTSLDREGRALAATVRASLEAGSLRSLPDATVRDLLRTTGWRVVVIPAARATGDVGPDATEGQLRRLRTMVEVPQQVYSEIDGDSLIEALPIRAVRGPDEPPGDPKLVAMLELARSTDGLGTSDGDIARAIVLVVVVTLATVVVVGVASSRLVSRPITKLLRGIDDVAKGDLSHVILSERDDEIGAIATRFNDMTSSLRESRQETTRHNEAKLALEQRLGQTEKLATIGQLAAEIAHEVGTPLNVIAGRARAIQRKARDPEAVDKNAAIVAEQTARITRIIQRLLDFTRRKVGAPERAVVHLDELASSTLELLAGQFSSARVKTRLDRDSELPGVAGDADRLQQVLINLMLNAVQAMPDGGSLAIETRAVTRARPGLEGGAEQSFVSVAVRDTGVGIPPGVRDKIFDPFYTTKTGQGGTGLGLAVCSGIVKEHDGWIDVDDGTHGGTVFTVYVPA
nr:ATP-binding protein [Kofleriaceae bacterium]